MKKYFYSMLSLCLMFCSLFMITGCGDPTLNSVLISHNGEKTANMHTYYEYGQELEVMYDMEIYACYSDGSEKKVLGEGIEMTKEQLAADFTIKYYKGVEKLLEEHPDGNGYETVYEEIEMLSMKPDVGSYLVKIAYKDSSEASLFIDIGLGDDPNTYTPKLQVSGIEYSNTTQYLVGTDEEDISFTLSRGSEDVTSIIDETFFITEATYNEIIEKSEEDESILTNYWSLMEALQGRYSFGSSAAHLKKGKWYLFCTTKEVGNYKKAVSRFVPITAKPGEFRFNPEAGTLKLQFSYNGYIDEYDEDGNFVGSTYPIGDVKVENCSFRIELNEGFASAFTLNGEPCDASVDHVYIGDVVSKSPSTRINYNKNGQKVYVTIDTTSTLQDYYTFVGEIQAVCEIERRSVRVPELRYADSYIRGQINEESGEYEILDQTVDIDYDIDYYGTNDACPIELITGSDITNSAVGTYGRTYKLKDALNYMWVDEDYYEVTAETFTEENCDDEELLKHLRYDAENERVTLTWKINKSTINDGAIFGLDMSVAYLDSLYYGAGRNYWDEETQEMKSGLFPKLDGVLYVVLYSDINRFYCSDINQLNFTIKKGNVDLTEDFVVGQGINFTYPATGDDEAENTYAPYWKLDFLSGSDYDGVGNYTISIEINNHPMVNDYSFEDDFDVPYQTLNCNDYCYDKETGNPIIPNDILEGTTLKSLVSALDKYSDLFTYTVELRVADNTDPNDRTLDTITPLNVDEYVFTSENFDYHHTLIAIHLEPTEQYNCILKVDNYSWHWIRVYSESV